MYKNFNLTEEERQQIMEMHQSHGYKAPINEQLTFVSQTSNVKKSVPSYWKAVSAYLRNNPMMGFKFVNFIEGIPTAGIEMKNDNGQTMFVEVDGRFTIHKSNGAGKSGMWRWDGVKVTMTMDTPRPLNEDIATDDSNTAAVNPTSGGNVKKNIEALGQQLLKFIQGKAYRFGASSSSQIPGVASFRINNLADRQHSNDKLQTLSQVKSQDFMFGVTIINAEPSTTTTGEVNTGFPFKKGQNAYVLMTLGYDNSKFVGITNVSLWDSNIKYEMKFGPMSQNLQSKIFGELQGTLNLETGYIPKPGEVIR